MSRVLPSAVATQAYNELGIANPKADELPSIIDKGLQKLYGYQHGNGTWGWFYDDDGSIYLTSYVLFGLTMVEKAGFAVDPMVLERGFNALDSLLDGRMTVGVTAASVIIALQDGVLGVDVKASGPTSYPPPPVMRSMTAGTAPQALAMTITARLCLLPNTFSIANASSCVDGEQR